MAISINKVSDEIKQKIIVDYKNNISLRELEKKYNVTRNTISVYLEKIGIKKIKGNHYRKYFHNEDFFEVIDTEEKAYWLGFMFADGYILDNSKYYGQDAFGMSLAEDSLDSLEKFKKSIQATNPITWEIKEGNEQSIGRLLMRSQKTVEDLIDKGCVKQKSLILQPPKNVPNNLIKHFIRGFFDGDGSLIKYEKTKNSIVYNINITSTYEMVKWICQILGMGQIFPEKRRQQTWYFVVGGNQQVIQIYHYLYDEATIWMDRKYKRFQELLSKYSEN